LGTNLGAFDFKGPPDDDDDEEEDDCIVLDDACIDEEDVCIDEEDADDDCNDGVNFFSILRFIELICYKIK